MLTQPNPTHGPHAPIRAVNGTGNTPNIGTVVGNPTFGTVHNPSRFLSRLSKFSNHLNHGLMQLSQIGGFGRPIVHLCIYVQSIFAVPDRKKLVGPYALEVGRLGSLLGRTDQ